MRFYYTQLLKYVSIFLIIYGAFHTICSFVLVFFAVDTGSVATFLGQNLSPAENLGTILSMVLLICQSLLLLLAGILGAKYHNDAEKISECVHLGAALMIVQAVYLIIDIKYATNLNLYQIFFSIAVPMIYYWSALQKRKLLTAA